MPFCEGVVGEILDEKVIFEQTARYFDLEPKLQPGSTPSHQAQRAHFFLKGLYVRDTLLVRWDLAFLGHKSNKLRTEHYKHLQGNHGYRQ